MTGAQAIELYSCICGENFNIKKDFTGHLLSAGRRDGKGIHKSRGRVNTETGEITMPPWEQRTDEQREESKESRRRDLPKGAKSNISNVSVRNTDILAGAQELKFVSRVYTLDYSPIVRMAQEAAVRYWGWPANLPLGDFLDTAIYRYFRSCGIQLLGIIIDETPEETRKREEKVAASNKQKESNNGSQT